MPEEKTRLDEIEEKVDRLIILTETLLQMISFDMSYEPDDDEYCEECQHQHYH